MRLSAGRCISSSGSSGDEFSDMKHEAVRRLLKDGEAFRIPGPFFSYKEMAADDGTHMLPAEGERERLRNLCGAAA